MAVMEKSEVDPSTSPTSSCRFEWDQDSNLYYHSSSGFYHDPIAGWYYNSRDGMYYTFENGSYVPFTFNENEGSNAYQCTSSFPGEPIQVEQRCSPLVDSEDIAYEQTERYCPPSEWLEETLIDLYLSGYSNSVVVPGEEVHLPDETSPDHLASEAGERTNVVTQEAQEPIEKILEEAEASPEEQIWQAQYGQVEKLEDNVSPSFTTIDLWDWEMVVETVRKKHQASRLIGRLVKRSAKLHPSMPSGGGVTRTTPIRGVHRDLVCVASGKVYRLRTPKTKYLASLSEYDASDPTKDWGFPDIYAGMENILPDNANKPCGREISKKISCDDSSSILDQISTTSDKDKPVYRDRASERRILHGGSNIGPGQKDSIDNINGTESYSQSSEVEIANAAAEAMNMSFGSGSYGRKIIERMGWKDGDSLGTTNSGILEPLQAVGNKGQTGLGWNRFSRFSRA